MNEQVDNNAPQEPQPTTEAQQQPQEAQQPQQPQEDATTMEGGGEVQQSDALHLDWGLVLTFFK